MSVGIITAPLPASAQIYHSRLLPTGDYNFYEWAFRKNVSYVRTGNEMIGAVYDRQQPDVITCFAATIYPDGVDVLWWENLWQINRPGRQTLNRFYSIADFTVDNSTPIPGLDNPFAVQQCSKML